MKCPKCQAKLLPVDGEMFCLQCGTAVHAAHSHDRSEPDLEDTTDPLLQKAITDTVRRPVTFKLPHSNVSPPPSATKAFSSMRAIMASPQLQAQSGVAALPVQVPVPVPASVSVQAAIPTAARGTPGIRLGYAGVAGIVALSAFVFLNLAVSVAFAERVYPGVKVGGVDVGGVSYGDLAQKLRAQAPRPTLTVHVESSHYEAPSGLGAADTDLAAQEAKRVGRSSQLPLAGLAQAWFGQPVPWKFKLNDVAVTTLASTIVNDAVAVPTEPVPMVIGTQVFVVPEKPGREVSLEAVKSVIERAYGGAEAVSVPIKPIPSLIAASAYSDEIQKMQNMLSLKLRFTAAKKVFSPTPEIIAGWLSIVGPGKGVVVDGSAVGAYVASLRGSFDRAAAATAFIAGLKSLRDVNVTVSAKKNIPVPQLPQVARSTPVASFAYCLSSDEAKFNEALRTRAQNVLREPTGWALGGKLSYVLASTDCQFKLGVVSKERMASAGAACAGGVSCQTGGRLLISEDAWQAAPKTWAGSLESYRGELINHELGHWLGFDHAPCLGRAESKPVLGSPTLVLNGCSPNWYLVPSEAQNDKVWTPLL